MPKMLPQVPNAEVTNALVDGSSREDLERPYPARDRLLLELLYGSGLRISEAVGLNLDDFDRTERWIRVRGKGKKERQVPYGAKSAEALDAYLEVRARMKRTRAISEPSRETADRSGRAGRYPLLRKLRGGGLIYSSAYAAPRVCDPLTKRRSRFASYSGVTRTCAAFDDAEVYAGFAGRLDEGL